MYHFISSSEKLGKPEEDDSVVKKKIIKPIAQRFFSLNDLSVTQMAASHVIVFGKKLQLYPLISRRIWSVLDPNHTKVVSFMQWMSILRVIALGSFDEKMGLAFKLFGNVRVCRQDVQELFSEIGEFLSEAGNGITDAIEFLVIKSFAWDEIFSKSGN